jgi:energy-coupling factor transport system ATP-binding protein
MSAITFCGVSFAYPDGPVALHDVSLDVRAGELLLVVGSSGSGKSTLLRAVNGIVPHSTGGRFSGSVVAFGRDVQHHRPRELTEVVGFVSQDPEAQLVVDEVEHDVAFALENLGMSATAMRRRVEEALDALGIAHLRRRTPTSLSGGERQRVAIAGAIVASPSALVLDEPTSQLDPQGADDVLAALARLNADLGTTVVLAEHRLERAAPLAQRAVVVADGVVPAPTDVGTALAGYPGAPPVVHLGRLLGWEPLPLTVRDARARAAERPGPPPNGTTVDPPAPGDELAAAQGIAVELGGRAVLHGVDFGVRRGEVVALLGRNGAGKTTLLRTLAGLTNATKGTIRSPARVAYVPQDPSSLLFSPTVRREVSQTLALLGKHDDGAVDAWLERLGIAPLADRHPRSLAGGERQRVAIAAVAVGGAEVLLLDEPTRGMDAASRHALEHAVRDHAASGGGVVLATHDVELAARCATRVVVLGDGDVVADGPGPEVLAGSLFAPQVLRVLPPFLTVADVESALAGEPA